MAARRTVRRAASKLPSLIGVLISVLSGGIAHAWRHMQAWRVLQDGAAPLPRNDTALHVRLDAVGTGIEGELALRRIGQARQDAARDHHNGAIGQPHPLPGIAATAAIAAPLPLRTRQMLPT